jgi:hypothetical protein
LVQVLLHFSGTRFTIKGEMLMSVSSLPQVYQPAYCQAIQSQQERSGDPLQIVEKTESTTQEDQVSISRGGRLLSNMPPLFSEEIEADGVISLDEMRDFFREKSAAFESEVRRRLNAIGVDATQTLDLTTDRKGNVRVEGDNPDKEKIEAMFADDPELANDFREVSSTGSFIKACEEYVEFAADYAKDPKAAVAKHWHLFSGMKDEYVLRLGDGEPSMVKKA